MLHWIPACAGMTAVAVHPLANSRRRWRIKPSTITKHSTAPQWTPTVIPKLAPNYFHVCGPQNEPRNRSAQYSVAAENDWSRALPENRPFSWGRFMHRVPANRETKRTHVHAEAFRRERPAGPARPDAQLQLRPAVQACATLQPAQQGMKPRRTLS